MSAKRTGDAACTYRLRRKQLFLLGKASESRGAAAVE
jgi:hypothetical protein